MLLFLCLSIGLLLSGCKEEVTPPLPPAELPPFEYATINIQDDFYSPHSGYFRGYATTLGNLTLGIDGGIYDEESAPARFREIEADYTVLQAFLANVLPLREITVNIEAGSIAIAYVKGSHIYFSDGACSPEEFQYALVRAATELEPWQCYGIQAMAFGDTERIAGNNSALQAHFQTIENLNMCSLFAGYFATNFNTDREIALAIQSAQSLAMYIIEQDGLPAFLTVTTLAPYVQGWLQSIGVERDYAPEFDLSEYANSTYTFPYGDSEHARFVMHTEVETFHFAPITEIFLTANDVLLFLNKYSKDKQALLQKICLEAPRNAGHVQERLHEPSEVFFEKQSNYYPISSTNHLNRIIQLVQTEVIMHELMHILIWRPERGWEIEGVAEYLSAEFMQDSLFPNFSEDFHQMTGSALDSVYTSYATTSNHMKMHLTYREARKESVCFA